MKNKLIIGLMILSYSAFGQIPGKKIDGPILIFDTLTVNKGDMIYLGKGSDPNSGAFSHITTPIKKLVNVPNKVIPIGTHTEYQLIAEGLSDGYNGRAYSIEHFSKVSSKKNGDDIFGVIDVGLSFDGKLDLSVYNQAVNFEAAILAGEIIKINDIDFTKPGKTTSREIPQFIFSKEGVQPIVVDFEGMNRSELFAGTLNWYQDYYRNKVENSIRTDENREVEIAGLKKGVLVSKIMGVELFLDIQYQFKIEFIENSIRMNFVSVDQMGQFLEEFSQEENDSVENSEKINKMTEDFKIEMEKMMNEISASLINYLMK
jgi:hypothetical protein